MSYEKYSVFQRKVQEGLRLSQNLADAGTTDLRPVFDTNVRNNLLTTLEFGYIRQLELWYQQIGVLLEELTPTPRNNPFED